MSGIPPGKSLVFLMHDVSRLFRRRMDQRAQTLGLTSAQWRILASLARAEYLGHGPFSQAGLADQMDMEAITLSRHIDRMTEAGLVERRANPSDRRAYHLYLTEAARPLVDKFRAMAAQGLAEVLEGIDETEIETVIDVLTRMRVNVVDKPASAAGVTEQDTPKKIASTGL
jgi:MarR family transcriptional regulator, transcriptional regulator for hemolysin